MMTEHERPSDRPPVLWAKLITRFEAVAIYGEAIKAARRADRKFFRGGRWTKKQIKAIRQQEAARLTAAATARAGERLPSLPRGALATPRGG